MKLNTFIKIFYDHRLKKASNIFKKIYIFLVIPFAFLIEKIKYQEIIDLDEYQNTNKGLFNKKLNYLFKYFNSDKGHEFINQYARYSKRKKGLIKGHNYTFYYEKFFKKIKNNKLKIFEIGSFKGNGTASFFFYFQNSKIYTADLYPDLLCYKSERIKSFKIDNSSEEDLEKLSKKIKYDIIIEDAGHYLKDQIISVFKLFYRLKKKGTFVIEELDFPDTRKDMNEHNDKNTLYNILRLIKKNRNFSSKYISIDEKKYFLKNYKKIKIYQGRFNKIAFITKK